MKESDLKLLKLRYVKNKSLQEIGKTLKKPKEQIGPLLYKLREKYKIKEEPTVDIDDTPLKSEFLLFLRFKKLPKEINEKIIGYLRSNKNILYAVGIAGEWDCILRIGAENSRQYNDILTEILTELDEHLLESKSIACLKIFKNTKLVVNEGILGLL